MKTNLSRPLQGIIFDLDGTLADTGLNFSQMCIDAGLSVGTRILEHCEELQDQEEVARILSIVEKHEIDGAYAASWIFDAESVLSRFYQANIPMAIVTRNMKEAARITIKRLGIPIDLVITREDCKPKPDPEGLLMVASGWGISPNELVYVGDFEFDLIAARDAGMMSCLVSNGRNQHLNSMADKVIYSFAELNQYFRF